MLEIDSLKKATTGEPAYRLQNAQVFISSAGIHYTRFLDAADESAAPPSHTDTVAYIEEMLQSNLERYENEVEIVSRHINPKDTRALDIGCGGGLFLSLLRDKGAAVCGLELNPTRAAHATSVRGLEIVMCPIEDASWNAVEPFDIVSLWDVIEHVNYPELTLRSCASALRKGGFLFIDTPCRDGFYHRVGALTYKLTRGRYPTFLNRMYSSHRFGHKQIFSTAELKGLVENAGFKVVELRKFHELSLPYRVYLRRMLGSDLLAQLTLPLVWTMLTLFPVKNKMLIVGRKI